MIVDWIYNNPIWLWGRNVPRYRRLARCEGTGDSRRAGEVRQRRRRYRMADAKDRQDARPGMEAAARPRDGDRDDTSADAGRGGDRSRDAQELERALQRSERAT